MFVYDTELGIFICMHMLDTELDTCVGGWWVVSRDGLSCNHSAGCWLTETVTIIRPGPI
jgi:hypothetical protein